MAVLPSGEQFELAFADQRACVVEVGGGLRTYEAAGRDVLLGYGSDEMCTAGRGQLLAPWPNRLADGRYTFDGRELQLPLTEPARGTAIHGLVRWATWTLAHRSPESVTLQHVLHPQPGYPFALLLQARYELGASGLTVTATAENAGSTACPFGLGFHPYLAGRVDDLTVSVPARTRLVTDDRGVEVDRKPGDLTEPQRVGSRAIDAAYTDLERDAAGRARVRVEDDVVWCDGTFRFLQVFSGDLPQIERRGLAVEPMTCAPNAFASGDGLLRLEPGERFVGSWGIEPDVTGRPQEAYNE
jgi:aldose 1-epimerase